MRLEESGRLCAKQIYQEAGEPCNAFPILLQEGGELWRMLCDPDIMLADAGGDSRPSMHSEPY